MNQKKIDELADELYSYILNMLDNEPEIGGFTAGEIAYEIEDKFRCELESFNEGT